MTSSIIVILFAVALICFAVMMAKNRTGGRGMLQSPEQHLHPVDVEAFRNLIDPAEEDFLRRRLPPADFRRIQRARLGAAREYIAGAARNARILLELAASARQSADPEVVEMAQTLIDEATQLRLYAFRAIPRIYFAMLFPSQGTSLIRVADGYERMTAKLVSLGRQYPAGRVTAAL